MINIQISTASGIKQILTINESLKFHELYSRIEDLIVSNVVVNLVVLTLKCCM